jgi:hypothetical protein
MTAKCVTCSRTVRDYRLCETCTGRLEQLIAELPALDRELELTETRQTAHGPRNGSRSAEKPVVFNPTAAQVRQDLRDTLTGWTADLPLSMGTLTVEGLSRRFLRHLPSIRQWENADTFTDELGYAVRQGWKCVDRPKDRTRIHLCACLEPSCPGELHAHIPVEDYDPHDDTTHSRIVCTVCEVVYPAEQWMHLGRRILALLAAA